MIDARCDLRIHDLLRRSSRPDQRKSGTISSDLYSWSSRIQAALRKTNQGLCSRYNSFDDEETILGK